MSNINAASRTVLVIGPGVSCVLTRGESPALDIIPTVGRSPTRLQNDAGTRIDPPVSSPTPISPMFAAIAAPVPALEPPVSRMVLYGFKVMPLREDAELKDAAKSWAVSKRPSHDVGTITWHCTLRQDYCACISQFLDQSCILLWCMQATNVSVCRWDILRVALVLDDDRNTVEGTNE